MTTLPGDFWQKEALFLAAVLRPHIQTLAIAGVNAANAKLEVMGIFFDIGLAHADAAEWARKYTDTLLQQFGATNQAVIGKMIATYAETPGMTIGELVKQLRPVLDDNQTRAWRVAVTETTRAFSEGNNIAYQRAGFPAMKVHAPLHPNCRCTDRVVKLKDGSHVIVFHTNRDEIVCTHPLHVEWIGVMDGCRAMNNVIISEGPHFGKKTSEV